MADCADKITEKEQQIQQLVQSVEDMRSRISQIDRAISESGATTATLRENLRIKKLANDITKIQAEIDGYDVDDAAKLRRNYEEQYPIEKAKETEMQTKVRTIQCHIRARLTCLCSMPILAVKLHPIRRS